MRPAGDGAKEAGNVQKGTCAEYAPQSRDGSQFRFLSKGRCVECCD